jgi:hypothetical protein
MSFLLPIFHATVLAPRLARRAYTLVRISNPSVDLKTWLDHVRACSTVRGSASGLVAMVDTRACIHGLFAWSVLCDLSNQKALRISDVVLAEVPGYALQRAIFVAFRDLARTKGAGIVVLLTSKQVGGLCRDAALANGFTLAGELLESVSSTGLEPRTAGLSGIRTQLGQFHAPS